MELTKQNASHGSAKRNQQQKLQAFHSEKWFAVQYHQQYSKY